MRIFVSTLLLLICAPVAALNLSDATIVDLSHPFNESTLYWPTSPTRFELQQLAHGHTDGGYFYSANAFCSPEHGGTHLDAPIHFFAERDTVDAIALERLIGPAVVIDVADKAAQDPDYLLSEEDVLNFERQHGRIEPGTIVLMRSGWSQHWPDAKAYLGDDTPGDASNLHFPSFGAEAARLLVLERQVAVLGVDTASIDYGQSRDFLVHRIASEHNVPGLENLTNLEQLPPRGAWVMALPINIEQGSGAPARVIGLRSKNATGSDRQ
jgi:kynurenine formamidase